MMSSRQNGTSSVKFLSSSPPTVAASVTIAGGGGEGTFAQQQKSAGLNAQADLSAQGGESTNRECDGGHDHP